MEPYINKEITKLRQQSQTEFKKDFFKLMNNYSVFFKKKVWKHERVDVRLVYDKSAKPNFESVRILVQIH